MLKIINRFLRRFGYLVISKKTLSKQTPHQLTEKYWIDNTSIPVLKTSLNGGLREKLIREGKTRWLEIGCGGTFEEYFTYIDLFPESLVNKKGRYFRIDITNFTDADKQNLGKFDLIRMQHVLEHFPPEEGLHVLKNCAKLLNPDGYILISTPDLRKYINMYLNKTIINYNDWALKRIHPDSPGSFFFSVYTHSMKYEKHEWCYDAEGIIYQLIQTREFKDIIEIKLEDKLANIPFTHKRPKEDVCIIARLADKNIH